MNKSKITLLTTLTVLAVIGLSWGGSFAYSEVSEWLMSREIQAHKDAQAELAQNNANLRAVNDANTKMIEANSLSWEYHDKEIQRLEAILNGDEDFTLPQ